MTDLGYARAQMGLSLAFHIVFAAIGVALPAFMVLAEWQWLRTRDRAWRDLAQRWSRGTAVLFAVGAVSGTVLSFELGLLWPKFMEVSGAVIGFPFALEGFAFFAEAIFLGIYLYGWEKVSPRLHLFAGVVVAVSGALSAFFVTLANAWMNAPVGFRLEAGAIVDPDPVVALFPPGWAEQVVHVLISSYMATAFAIAGVHAILILRGRKSAIHRHALVLTLTVGAVCAVLMPLSGDFAARSVARKQPAKFAALESNFETRSHAPLKIGGWPDPDAQTTRFAIEIPSGLSFLAFHDPSATVTGLDAFPRADWPDVRTVHVSFQLMIACGMALLALSAACAFLWWRPDRALRALRGSAPAPPRVLPENKWLLIAIASAMPLGFVAIEAGWMVTEKGRQPWIIQSVLRTGDASTPFPGLAFSFYGIVAIYLALGAMTAFVLVRQIETIGTPQEKKPNAG